MSKKRQDARFKKYRSQPSDYPQPAKVKKYFLHAVNQVKVTSHALHALSELKLADKSSGMYYELFDFGTRGDKFRIEVIPTDYAVDTKVYIDGKLVQEEMALYNLNLFDAKSPSYGDILDAMPSEYVSSSYRKNPSGTEAMGGLFIAGLIGYAIGKKR